MPLRMAALAGRQVLANDSSQRLRRVLLVPSSWLQGGVPYTKLRFPQRLM